MGDKFTLDELHLLEELIYEWYKNSTKVLKCSILNTIEISVENAQKMLSNVYDTWVSISNKLEAREVTAK